MKLYKVEGKGFFRGVISLVMESSAVKAKALVAKNSIVKVEELKCTVLRFGSDRDGIVMVAHDFNTGDTEFNDKVLEKG